MQTGTIASTINIGGVGFTGTTTFSADGQISQVVALPAGVAGTVSGVSGLNNLPTGHGFQVGQVVDVHWTDIYGVRHSRRELTITAVDVNTIGFGGTPEGDALPAIATPVIVGLVVPVLTTWAGDDTMIVAARTSDLSTVDFRTSGASVAHVELIAGGVWSWASGLGANPLAGNTIVTVHASSAGTVAQTLWLGVLYNSVH